MAIKTHLREQATLILSFDDALAGTPEERAAAYAAYLNAGFDESLLRLQGAPTRFVIQPLTYDQRQRARDLESGAERVEHLLRCSLLKVTGYQVEHENGTMVELRPVEHEDSPQWRRPIVKREWLVAAQLPTGVASEIAAAARMLSEGSIPFCRASAPPSMPGDFAAESQPSQAA
jgi:hypothetical protein